MSIATAIQAARQKVANAYTSVSTMGGTLPQTQNLSNLPSSIASIPKGGSSKYGCTLDNFLGDFDANGKIQPPSDITGDIVFNGISDVGDNALTRVFSYKTNIKNGVVFPYLETISGTFGCYYMFSGCTNLTSASFPSLTTISGSFGCGDMFQSCTSLTSVSFPNLTTISGLNGCSYMFSACTGLTSVSFPNLTTISVNGGCGSMFSGCSNIESISFPALTTSSFGSYTNQFNNMMSSTGTSKTHTIHFPSNLESTISGLTGYPLFGGTSGYVTLAFDLPATS